MIGSRVAMVGRVEVEVERWDKAKEKQEGLNDDGVEMLGAFLRPTRPRFLGAFLRDT